MAKYKPINSQKINRLINFINKNKYDIHNLKKVTIHLKPVHFNKRIRFYHLVENEFIPNSGDVLYIYVTQIFEDLPEWAISHIRVVGVISGTSGYLPPADPAHEVTLQSDITHMWKLIDKTNSTWKLEVNAKARQFTRAEGNGTNHYMPLYLDVKVYFYNQKIYHEVQHNSD